MSFRLFVLAAPLTVSLAVGCAPAQDCAISSDCAMGLSCVEGSCTAGGTGRQNFVERTPEPEFDVEEIGGAVVLAGTSPRVFVGDDGAVDIYFLQDPCGELMRARPLLDTVDVDVDVIARPPEGTCFADLDVARTADGIDHAAVRHEREDGSGAVTIEIDVDGIVGAMKSFPPASEGDLRGWLPRVSVDADGVAHAVWTHGHDIDGVRVMDVERVALPATAQPALAAELASVPAGLALAFDVDGVPAVFSLDYLDDTNRLVATYDTARTLSKPFSSGTIDATQCGDNLVNAFRFDNDLRIATLAPDSAPAQLVVDDNLDARRLQGDLAMTCANDVVWIAHQSGDRLRFYREQTQILEINDDARTVGIAVVGTTAHMAYTTSTGTLRYATFTP